MDRKFSVIIATCNREELVCQAIDSVLAQTFKDYEIILVDDGSAVETKENIKARYGNLIQFVESNKQGSERAYQQGGLVATGRYLAFLDDDDMYLPWTLATYDKIIRDFNSPPVILGSMHYLREDHYDCSQHSNIKDIEVLKYKDFLSKEGVIGLSQSRIVMQKNVFVTVNKNRQEQPFILNDYRLMFLVGSCGPCIITKHPTTVIYRQHQTQATKNVEKMSRGVLELIHSIRSPASGCQCRHAKSTRHFDNYAYLGGPIKEWSKKAVRAKRPELALKLLVNGWPMVAAATVKKFQLAFRRAIPPQVLSNEEQKNYHQEGS